MVNAVLEDGCAYFMLVQNSHNAHTYAHFLSELHKAMMIKDPNY